MITKKTIVVLRRAARLIAVALAVGLPLGLWIGGAQPIAVGLVPTPWDKLVHLTVFGVLAAAIGCANGSHSGRAALLAFACALAVGVVDEWHQAYLPGRSAGLDDLAADALGSALGAWAFHHRAKLKSWYMSCHG